MRANIWIAIFSFIGNYFWTHYFYTLLGASYTFKAHELNGVGGRVGGWVGGRGGMGACGQGRPPERPKLCM